MLLSVAFGQHNKDLGVSLGHNLDMLHDWSLPGNKMLLTNERTYYCYTLTVAADELLFVTDGFLEIKHKPILSPQKTLTLFSKLKIYSVKTGEWSEFFELHRQFPGICGRQTW